MIFVLGVFFFVQIVKILIKIEIRRKLNVLRTEILWITTIRFKVTLNILCKIVYKTRFKCN